MKHRRLLVPVVLVVLVVAGVVMWQVPRATAQSPTVELFGRVNLVEGYSLPTYTGCHALVALRDTPGTTVAVMTKEPRLQSLLETALSTGKLVAFWGQKNTRPVSPRGGTWSVTVYDIDGVILYK